MSEFKPKDVIKIIKGQCKNQTGVINRVDGANINIFLKNQYIGIWFDKKEVKRIGRVYDRR